MLAIKATYDNGMVRWSRKPPVDGLHDLIVVFADIGDEHSDSNDNRAVKRKSARKRAILSLRGMCSNLGAGVSMADDLISERRREAVNEK